MLICVQWGHDCLVILSIFCNNYSLLYQVKTNNRKIHLPEDKATFPYFSSHAPLALALLQLLDLLPDFVVTMTLEVPCSLFTQVPAYPCSSFLLPRLLSLSLLRFILMSLVPSGCTLGHLFKIVWFISIYPSGVLPSSGGILLEAGNKTWFSCRRCPTVLTEGEGMWLHEGRKCYRVSGARPPEGEKALGKTVGVVQVFHISIQEIIFKVLTSCFLNR